MTETIKVSDTSVDKAIQKALRQLQLTREEVDVQVLEEGKKGLFGFGQKNAVIAVTPKPQEEPVVEVEEVIVEAVPVDEPEVIEEELVVVEDDSEVAARLTKEYLEGVAAAYGAPATVTVEVRKEKMSFVFETEKPGLLIGKYGKTLNALQVLAQVSVHRYVKGRMSVQVDVGDYRERRTESLQQMAERTARRVLKTKQPVYLEPLPAYERKQIHAYLSKNKRIKTHSEGSEPHRYLVVEPVD